MKNKLAFLPAFALLMAWSSGCFPKDILNVVVLPDPFGCHQLGLDIALTENTTLGILGRYECKSDRPTYGSSNNQVSTTFRRILIPWRYSVSGAFIDGYFIQAMVGAENSAFTSDAGSYASVTFIDVGFHAGYQLFWRHGFNVSALAGVAILTKSSVNKTFIPNESSNVIGFLDKNTKSNVHPGVGVELGWSF